MRIKLKNPSQRDFLKRVLENTGCPSLKELISRGIDISYPGLKNYFSERRFFSQELFEKLCTISKISKETLSFEVLNDSWGQTKGGKISKRIR